MGRCCRNFAHYQILIEVIYMKKKFLILLVALIIALCPIIARADTQTLNLNDTLIAEDITPEYEDYKETEEQVTIYLFRGAGCTHCYDFLTYLNSITKEYGNMFKLRSFEVYNNQDNAALKDKVAKFFKEKADGVPYIIIGENTFYGFSDDMKEKVLKSIKNEYNAEVKYDIFDEMDKNETKKNPNDALFLLIPIAAIIIIVIIVRSAKKED